MSEEAVNPLHDCEFDTSILLARIIRTYSLTSALLRVCDKQSRIVEEVMGLNNGKFTLDERVYVGKRRRMTSGKCSEIYANPSEMDGCQIQQPKGHRQDGEIRSE